MQDGIDVQGGIFWKILHGLYTYMVCIPMTNFEHTNTNKRAGWNKRAGRNFFSKSINVQTKIRPCRGKFFLKINKRADQNKAVHIGWNKRAGGFFSQNH